MPWSSLGGIALVAFLWLDRFRIDSSKPALTLALASIFAVLFYVSILGHELAHAWVANAAGYPVRGITLWVFGGFTSYERVTTSALREGLIAASGPLTSLVIGLVCRALATTSLADDERVYVVLWVLGVSNILLAAYNALPGLPLDGGAVLKAVLWGVLRDERRATVAAAWSGRVVAVAVFLVPQFLVWRRGGAPNLGSIFVGLFISGWLYTAASASLRQAQVSGRVPTLSARGLARPAVAVAHDTPLSEALRRRDEAGVTSIVVVDAEGRPRAVSQEAAVDAVPLERRPWVPVSSVAVGLDPRAVIVGDPRGEALLQAMLATEAPQYLVVDADGTWFGTLARSDVEAALAGRR
jgi:Zn-dependent protease